MLAGLVSSTCGSQVPVRHPGAFAGANRAYMYTPDAASVCLFSNGYLVNLYLQISRPKFTAERAVHQNSYRINFPDVAKACKIL